MNMSQLIKTKGQIKNNSYMRYNKWHEGWEYMGYCGNNEAAHTDNP